MIGSLASGGSFAPGGMLTVTGNGMHGVPSGILFQGTFTSGTWVVTPTPVGNLFTFIGTLIGTGAFSGTPASTVQSSKLISGPNPFAPGGSGRAPAAPGSLSAGVVPEPGTLALMGTGILGIAAGIRRKLLKN
jgi:hypothetical protein